MPANLTPQYQKAEDEYRRAQSADERLRCLEQMLQLIPKHKGTEKLQADIKSRIRETRDDVEQEKKASAKKGPSYRFPRQGAGRVILLGAPNSGKSRILESLTKAHPNVADFPFATHEPLPGMMDWEDTTVQLIDTPPISDSHFEAYMTNLVRVADAAVLTFDGRSDDAIEETMTVIQKLEARKTRLSDRTGFDEEDFSILHVRTLMVVTHGGDTDAETRLEFYREAGGRQFETLIVDLDEIDDVESLRNAVYDSLGVVRAYTKRPGKPGEFVDPFSLPAGGTVEDLACLVHREMAEKLKFARIWGSSAHEGQSVGKDHQLADRDMVELHW